MFKRAVRRALYVCGAISCLVPLSWAGPALAQSEDVQNTQIQTVLVAKQEAMLASPIEGRIVELEFFNGDRFSKDDILVRYDCSIQEAQYEQSQARYDYAQSTLKAKRKLSELRSASKLEIELAEAEEHQARAQVAEFKARLDLCALKAPFDGRITARQANNYEMVELGRPLLAIASLDNLQAQLIVPSDWLSWVKEGTPLTMEIHENGKRYPARVIRVAGAVDPISQSITIVAELNENQDELLPGMSGTAFFDAP